MAIQYIMAISPPSQSSIISFASTVISPDKISPGRFPLRSISAGSHKTVCAHPSIISFTQTISNHGISRSRASTSPQRSLLPGSWPCGSSRYLLPTNHWRHQRPRPVYHEKSRGVENSREHGRIRRKDRLLDYPLLQVNTRSNDAPPKKIPSQLLKNLMG
jgi:hypothetical protein